MKRLKALSMFIAVFVSLAIPCVLFARDINPIVSSEWLDQSLSNPKLVMVDIRKVEEYKAGHVPGAINVFYNIWAPKKGELRNELPADDDLRDILSSNGIGIDSLITVVGKTDTMSDRFDSSRVAWTLLYAGVPNVAILDGGFNKWTAEGRKTSTDAVKPKEKSFKGKFNKAMFVNRDYLLSHLDKALIVDVREPDFYNGTKKLDFVSRMGHIKGAVNLPSSQLFTKDGTYKDKNAISDLLSKIIGNDMDREMILYCDTGKVATAYGFLLKEMFGYKNVKLYDGSSEEWTKDSNVPMEP